MRAEQDATVAKIKAGWPQPRVYNVGEVPPSPVVPYMDVAVALGTPVNYRVGSRTTARTYRATVRSFAKYFDDVAAAAEAADDALLGERITPDYSRCRGEVATGVIKDKDGGGLLMIVRTYTFSKHA